MGKTEEGLVSVEDQVSLDLARAERRQFGEAVLCETKTRSQLEHIAGVIGESGVQTLFTRAGKGHAMTIKSKLPDASYHHEARLLVWPPELPESAGGKVVIVTAGTSDSSVALEAYWTARYLGRRADIIYDAGVAGLHRILGSLESLRAADVIVVAAGMDGALPSVVAGLVKVPVVALPTSVGYGAAFSGIAPLLSMLNSCSPGVAVVNIDNGYGAGYLAAQIAKGMTELPSEAGI